MLATLFDCCFSCCRRRDPDATSASRPTWCRPARLHSTTVDRRPAELLRRAVHHTPLQRRRSSRLVQPRGQRSCPRHRATGNDQRDTSAAAADRGKDGGGRTADGRRGRMATGSHSHRPMSLPSLPCNNCRQFSYRSSSRSALLASTLDGLPLHHGR